MTEYIYGNCLTTLHILLIITSLRTFFLTFLLAYFLLLTYLPHYKKMHLFDHTLSLLSLEETRKLTTQITGSLRKRDTNQMPNTRKKDKKRIKGVPGGCGARQRSPARGCYLE